MQYPVDNLLLDQRKDQEMSMKKVADIAHPVSCFIQRNRPRLTRDATTIYSTGVDLLEIRD
jgi:hypothetical protein